MSAASQLNPSWQKLVDATGPDADDGLQQDGAIRALATEAGVPASLAALLARTVSDVNERPSMLPELRRALTGVVPGAHLAPVVHEWIGWLWRDAPEPLEPLVTEATAQSSVAGVLGLHTDVLVGRAVTRQAWRAARAAVNQEVAKQSNLADALSVIAAAAWDFDAVPGASDDTLAAWEALVQRRLHAEDGWGETEDAARKVLMQSLLQQINAQTGVAPNKGDTAAFSEYRKRYHELVRRMIHECTEPLHVRGMALHSRVIDGVRQLRTQNLSALAAMMVTHSAKVA